MTLHEHPVISYKRASKSAILQPETLGIGIEPILEQVPDMDKTSDPQNPKTLKALTPKLPKR